MQEKKPNQLKMSFEDYHELTTKLTAALRDEIMQKLGISYAAYYIKLKANTWTISERELRDKIYTSHVNTLVQNLVE